MNARARSRNAASIGSNQPSNRATPASASGCTASGFVVGLAMAWSPARRASTGLVRVGQPGDYATPNSNQPRDGTSLSSIRLSPISRPRYSPSSTLTLRLSEMSPLALVLTSASGILTRWLPHGTGQVAAAMAVLEREMATTDPFPTESCAKRALQRLGLALARRPEGGSSSEACADPPGIGVCRCGAGALLEPV